MNVLSHIIGRSNSTGTKLCARCHCAAGQGLYSTYCLNTFERPVERSLFYFYCSIVWHKIMRYVSAAGFVLFVFLGKKSVLFLLLYCLFMYGFHCFFAGLVLFLLLGLTGSAAFYTSMCRMKTEQYLARTVGISYALGILLQFVNNNLIRSELAEMIVLFVFLLILIALLLKWDYCKEDKVQTNLF